MGELSSVLPTFLFTVLGIVNAILERCLYEQKSMGIEVYGVHRFVKPLFFATMLSAGVVNSLIIYFLIHSCSGKHAKPLVSRAPFSCFDFVIPGFFGLFQGIMSSITTTMLGVSIDYMMRSATLIGVTLIAVFWFHRRFQTHERIGIIVVSLGLLFVGYSSILSAGNSSTIRVSKKWTVVILIFKVISQIAYAVKLSIEQHFTQQKKIPILLVTGLQSAWSAAIGAFVVLPLAHLMSGDEGNGFHENIVDTFMQLKNNHTIVMIVVIAISIECAYIISSVALTSATSAVSRMLVECVRNFIIWIVQLAIFYSMSASEQWRQYRCIGEEWSKGSWLQLIGYVILMVGIAIHKREPMKAFSRETIAHGFSEL